MIIAIVKPKGPTSHDIVAAVRRITSERRVGHAGTLDPMAEGVLVVGIGRPATKQLGTIASGEKEYLATVHLGATSDTDDAEGRIVESEGATAPRQADVARVLASCIGTIEQVPPTYSAIKIKGKPAHRRVRSGEAVALPPRTVTMTTIEIIAYAWPELRIRIVCGKGTYIRALARDIGARLGVGGYLTALTRTRVGAFAIEDALTLEAFAQRWNEIPKVTPSPPEAPRPSS